MPSTSMIRGTMRCRRRFSDLRCFVATAIAFGAFAAALAGCGGSHPDASTASPTFRFSPSVESSTTVGLASDRAKFPLRVDPSRRYLIDADSRPFLINGEAAWSLIAQLRDEDVVKYLDDRRARGFNTVIVNLLEHKFATNAPLDVYGEPPFLKTGDYSTPNDAYFTHAERVVQMAADRGMLVLLAPSYLGYKGTSEGWYDEMVQNGTAKLRDYGNYVGSRFRKYANIIWLEAGDRDPPSKGVVDAIVDGISAADPSALHTAAGAPETSAVDYWGDRPWLSINTVYTYGSVCGVALKQPTRQPYFLVESTYENEHEATPLLLRTQAYHAVLCGGFGSVFGNNPIWHFDGPGLFTVDTTWQEALASEGSQGMRYLRQLFEGLPWWSLAPDADGKLLTGGRGDGNSRAAAAASDDGSIAVVYVPTARTITLDLTRMRGQPVRASWYDPTSGEFADAAQATGPISHVQMRSPGANRNGAPDWVLVLHAS